MDRKEATVGANLAGINRRERRFRIALAVLCTIGAAAAIRRIVALETARLAGPSQFPHLDAHFAAKASATLLHVVPSLVFVLLVLLQFTSSLRSQHPQLHRRIGRLAMGLGVVLGTSALWLSAHPVGGVVEGSATILFGCLFLFSLCRAWWHIRNRRVELHREWITRMVALALGVATTRPIIAAFFATSPLTGLSPEQFFGPAMWLGFTATFAAGEAWIRRTRSRVVREGGEDIRLTNQAAP